ncbi:MAG: hypothetical protein WCI17_09360 [bacterium]
MQQEAPSLSPVFCRLLVLCSALLVAGYGVFLGAGSNTGFPDSARFASRMPYLSDNPLGEDAFYMMHVAWNLASGNGPVCNEGSVVTGIQPLTTLVYAGLAWVDLRAGGDKWGFLRLVLLLNVLLVLTFAHLVGRIAAAISTQRKIPAYGLGFLLSAFGFTLFRHFAYGLETGMYLNAFAAIILFSLRHIPFPRQRDVVLFGMLGGLCGWCRIDFGLCFAVFLLSMLLARVLTLKQCLISGSVALLVLAPWFSWVYSVSGSPMPSSGMAESRLFPLPSSGTALFGMLSHSDRPFLRLAVMSMAVVDNLVPCLDTAGRWPLVIAKGVVFTVCLGALAAWRREIRAALCGGRVWLGWVLAIFALVPVYLVFFCSVWFYFRYTAPLLILTYAFFAAAGVNLAPGYLARPKGLVMLGGVLCCLFAVLAVDSIHSGRSWYGYSVTAGFVQRNLAHIKKVGAFQCGKIGFFCPNVINLDGKVNAAVLPFIPGGRVAEYLDQEKIGMLVDWPSCILDYIPASRLQADWQRSPQKPDTFPATECYLRIAGAAKPGASAIPPTPAGP